MIKKILLFFVLIFLTGMPLSHSKEGEKCINIKINCSCNDASTIYRHGLNNNPYKIERIDFPKDKNELNSICSKELSDIVGQTGTDFTSIFKVNPLKSKLSLENFFQYMRNDIVKTSLKRFPITSSDLEELTPINTKAVCIPKGLNNSMVSTSNGIELKALPNLEKIDGLKQIDIKKIKDQSCLTYLPYPYLVTNNKQPMELGLFEGSYVTNALIRTEENTRLLLAKDMLKNFLYEIEHFGFAIQSNRGFMLERSQNNSLSSVIWNYFQKTNNISWLESKGLPAILNIVKFWDTRIGIVQLGDRDDPEEANRWFSLNSQPMYEYWNENNFTNPYYFERLYNLIQIALTKDPTRPEYTKRFDYNSVLYTAPAKEIANWKNQKLLEPVNIEFDSEELTSKLKDRTYILRSPNGNNKSPKPVLERNGIFFYLSDRFYSNNKALGISGYNTDLYGPFGAFTDEFIDVALNIEIFRAKTILAKIYTLLSKHYAERDKKLAKTYKEKTEVYEAEARTKKDIIFRYLWDNKEGMLFNYSYHTDLKHTNYPYASAANSLAAEIFDINIKNEQDMLSELVLYLTNNLETLDGLQSSNVESGLTWDKPYVQGSQNAMYVLGLRKYAQILAKNGQEQLGNKLAMIGDRISLKYITYIFSKWVDLNTHANTEELNLTDAAAIWDIHSNLPQKAIDILNFNPNIGNTY